MSPLKAIIDADAIDELNKKPETKAEIKERLKTFAQIKENQFLCERSVKRILQNM